MADRGKTLRVRMAPGKTMPVPPGVVIDSPLTVLTPEDVVEVHDNRFTHRRIESGDWVLDEGVSDAGDTQPLLRRGGEVAPVTVPPLFDSSDVEAEAAAQPAEPEHKTGFFGRFKDKE